MGVQESSSRNPPQEYVGVQESLAGKLLIFLLIELFFVLCHRSKRGVFQGIDYRDKAGDFLLEFLFCEGVFPCFVVDGFLLPYNRYENR